MKTVVIKSVLFSVICVVVSYLFRVIFRTDQNLVDVGGISVFIGGFGTLYGILIAFVVFEVWGQYNKTASLIDQESQALERLYRLILYFRDKKLTQKMKTAIFAYSNNIVEGKFQTLGVGNRNVENGKLFRNISVIIRNIEFNDDHDGVVYGKVLDHYGHLFEIRTERISQSLARIPVLLKVFVYTASAFVVFSFLVLPFASFYYSVLGTVAVSFMISMVYQLIEDLDNPFVGTWNISPEPFSRALKHIEEDY